MWWVSRSKSHAVESDSADLDTDGSPSSSPIEGRFRSLQRALGNQAVQRAFSVPVRDGNAARDRAPPPESAGEALSPETREQMEPPFGRRFDDVRLHTDAPAAESAEAIDASAYTVGRDIYFAPGMYAPHTAEGRHLLAHELAHVTQQDVGSSSANPHRISRSTDAAERDADRAAVSATLGHPVGPLGGPDATIARDEKKPAKTATEKDPIGDVLGVADTVATQGDPASQPNYVQNAIRGVGIFGWGGPFRLDRQIVDGMGVDSIYLPRNEFKLADDPLKGLAIAINLVYKSRAAADAALAKNAMAGSFTFYVGPGGLIYPTIISDTTAPALCAALRKAVELERTDAKAAEKTSIDLLLWYVGARFPMKTSVPSTGESVARVGAAGPPAAQAAAGGSRAITFVEIGAGDLKASIELAKKGVVKVIAVDPAAPSAAAVRELEAAGGSFVRGTAADLSPGVADHVFQYFPWRIGGTGGRVATGGTFRLVEDTMKLLKPGGAAHVVTEDLATAEYLAGQASSRGARVVLTETTAGAAAPGASGAGVPNFSSSSKVWMVNIYP